MPSQTLRQYLESQLHASSEDNPSASEFLLQEAGKLEELGRPDLAERLASKSLDMLVMEAGHREDFLLPLKRKITSKKLIQLLKSFYEQQGFECYKESTRHFKVYSEAFEIFCYFFRQNEHSIEVTITRSNPDELLVSSNYFKRKD